jgi:hypothetical protein
MRSAQAPRAASICGLTRAIHGSRATRAVLDTVSTLYAEVFNFPSIKAAGPVGLRGDAEGIERFELTSEQSDITSTPRRNVGKVAAVATTRLKGSPHWAKT